MIQQGNQEGMLLTAAQLDYRQRKRKPSTDWYKIFDNIVLVAILVSSAMLPLENPVSDPKSQAVIYAKKANLFFTIFFIFELTVKSIGQGFYYSSIDIIEPYMSSGWNRIDAFVVFISMIQLLCQVLGIQNQYPWLKAMRALRALRPLRVIRRSETLRVVVNALLSTVGAVGNVMLVGFLLLLMFAVMGINLLKGSLYSCSAGGPPEIQTK
jgi:voltage-dependent calcium channel L type alpha-1D